MTILEIIVWGAFIAIMLLVIGTIGSAIMKDLNDKDSRGGMP